MVPGEFDCQFVISKFKGSVGAHKLVVDPGEDNPPAGLDTFLTVYTFVMSHPLAA